MHILSGEATVIFTFASFLNRDHARGYKTFFMLSSAEHEILSAQNLKYIKKFSFFEAQINLECYFSCS